MLLSPQVALTASEMFQSSATCVSWCLLRWTQLPSKQKGSAGRKRCTAPGLGSASARVTQLSWRRRETLRRRRVLGPAVRRGEQLATPGAPRARS